MTSLNALLIMDRPVSQSRYPGARLRVQALSDFLARSEYSIQLESVVVNSNASPLSRLIHLPLAIRRLRKHARSFDLVVVAALNAPHMILLAGKVARSATVLLDVCDSLVETKFSARRNGDRSLYWRTLLGLKFLRGAADSLICAYITERDARQDVRLAENSRTVVIPQTPPVKLLALQAFQGPPTRIVVPVDLSSPHNLLLFKAFLSAVRSGELKLGCPVHIYGPVAPDEPLPKGCEFVGWADELADVYAGETAVFAPNIDPIGLQNKFFEAACAGRPIVIGYAAAKALPDYRGVHAFSSFSDMVDQLHAVQKCVGPIARLRLDQYLGAIDLAGSVVSREIARRMQSD